MVDNWSGKSPYALTGSLLVGPSTIFVGSLAASSREWQNAAFRLGKKCLSAPSLGFLPLDTALAALKLYFWTGGFIAIIAGAQALRFLLAVFNLASGIIALAIFFCWSSAYDFQTGTIEFCHLIHSLKEAGNKLFKK